MMTMSHVDGEAAEEEARMNEVEAPAPAISRVQLQDVVREVLQEMLERYRRSRGRPQ